MSNSQNLNRITLTPSNQVGIGVSSLCAFELFKEFGASGEHEGGDDKFFNIAG